MSLVKRTMSLPSPHHVFSVPSLHDNVPLDGRIYHPPNSQNTLLRETGLSCSSTSINATRNSSLHTKLGAVLAHSYAPLGGCLYDPVIDRVAYELLRKGFIVFIFNFRGASSSPIPNYTSKTSWSGKPEVADMKTIICLMLIYLANLKPLRSLYTDDTGIRRKCSQTKILLGGYSYGSLITANLPTINEILQQFHDNKLSPPYSEIAQRARALADLSRVRLMEQASQRLLAYRNCQPGSFMPNDPNRMLCTRNHGTKDSTPGKFNPNSPFYLPSPADQGSFTTVPSSIDSNTTSSALFTSSSDKVGKGDSSDETAGCEDTSESVQIVGSSHTKATETREALATPANYSTTDGETIVFRSTAPEESSTKAELGSCTGEGTSSSSTGLHAREDEFDDPCIPDPNSVTEEFLLISPLMLPLSRLTAFRLRSGYMNCKLWQNGCLAISGDEDPFCSIRRMNAWKKALCKLGGDEGIQTSIVPNAGHFWYRADALRHLVITINDWLSSRQHR